MYSQTITFESLDVGSYYLHILYISTEYGSSSYMKVIEPRSQQQRKLQMPVYALINVCRQFSPAGGVRLDGMLVYVDFSSKFT